MGNCIRKESSTRRGGQVRGYTVSDLTSAMKVVGEVSAGEEKKAPFPHPAATDGTEVKIKITKKQLKEILGTMDVQGLSLQQVLTQLMNLGDGFDYKRQPRSWRPRLESIPETELF